MKMSNAAGSELLKLGKDKDHHNIHYPADSWRENM